MKISVFGLGYVGTVCAACLADRGHDVIGVDKLASKVGEIQSGRSPVLEQGIDELLARVVQAGRLTATRDAFEAVAATDMSLVCVGTPSEPDGAIGLEAIETVITEIAKAIRAKTTRHEIVIRSTVLPGTTRDIIAPRVHAISGKALGEAFGVAFNPEFLRAGSSISDFMNPSRTIVGAFDKASAAAVMSLYEDFPGVKVVTGIETAEFVKYVDNAWHALKATFANEIGLLAKALALDSREVMRIFCEDRQLNISTAYLRPAFAFGGSCLPKDLRALLDLSRRLGLSVPVLEHILASNRLLVDRGVEWIAGSKGKRIAFLGMSFKSGTDELRESPFVELIKRLLEQDREIRIFDPNVVLGRLVGANKDYLMSAIPTIGQLMVPDIAMAVEWAQTIVLTVDHPAYEAGLTNVRSDQIVLDLGHLEFPDRIPVQPLGLPPTSPPPSPRSPPSASLALSPLPAPEPRTPHLLELFAFKASAGRRSIGQDVSSSLAIDVVIPAAAKDAETVPYCIEGVRRNLKHPLGSIFVIGETDAGLRDVVQRTGARFVDENAMLPLRRTDIAYVVDGIDRSGWLFQKLLKYAGAALTDKTHYLVIDSDTVLLRPQVFELGGTPLVLHADEHHETYFQVCKSMLGYPRVTELSCVAHMALIDVGRLRALKEHLECRFHCRWFEAFVRNTRMEDASGSSDYELYGQWCLSQYPFDNIREYFFNSELGRAELRPVGELERRYGADYRSLSFHSYRARDWMPPFPSERIGMDGSRAGGSSASDP